jgi:hypothetical protein
MSVERRLLKGVAISVAVGGMVIGGAIEGAKRNTSAAWADFANLIDSPKRASETGQMALRVDEELIKSLLATEKLFVGSKGNLRVSYHTLDGRKLEDGGMQINLEDSNASEQMEELIRNIWTTKTKIWDLHLGLSVQWPEAQVKSEMEVFVGPLAQDLSRNQVFSVSYALEDEKTGYVLKLNNSFDSLGVKNAREDGVYFFRDGEWWKATPKRITEMKERFEAFIPSGVTSLFGVK